MVVNDKLIYYNDHFNRVYKYQIIMLFTGNNMLYVKYTPIKKKKFKERTLRCPAGSVIRECNS